MIDVARLKSVLLVSGLQKSNNPLYQIILQLINGISDLNSSVTKSSNSSTTIIAGAQNIISGEDNIIEESIFPLYEQFWKRTNTGIYYNDGDVGIGTSAPTVPLDIASNATVGINLTGSNDGQYRLRVVNSSTGVNAFADMQIQCGTTQFFVGASGQNYSFAGPATAAGRSWLDTSNTLGAGWDFSAPASNGNHKFYTVGYGATNLRVTIDVSGLLISNNGILDVQRTALGTTSADGVVAENITAATGATTVQISPRLRMRGTAWDTAASETVEFYQEVLPASAATPTGTLKWVYSLNGAAGTTLLSLSSIGNLTMSGNMIATDYQSTGANGYQAANGAFFFWASRSAFSSPADGQLKISNNAVSAGVILDVATDATLKLRNRSATAGTGNLDIGAKLSAYNAINTAGWGLSAIYGSGRSTAQTGDVASVAAYTVGAADGSFIVSCNVNVTAFTAGTQSIRIDYTDETNTARTLSLTVSSITGTFGLTIGATGAFEGVPLHIRCKASTSITIKTVGTVWNGTYNVEGVIIQVA